MAVLMWKQVGSKKNIKPFLQTISQNEENLAFKDIKVRKENGKYLITGKVKAEKHSVYYTVEDGHNELVLETAIS